MKNILFIGVICLLFTISCFCQSQDTSLVSEVEMKKIQTDLMFMSNPFTLKELYSFTTSTMIPKGGTVGAAKIDSITNLYTYYQATIGEKIEVISINSGQISIGISWCGDIMCFFEREEGISYNPKRLFTLYKPSGNEPTGVYFEKIIIWDTYKTPKYTFALKDGKWYKQ
jgi:hypothetical protein